MGLYLLGLAGGSAGDCSAFSSDGSSARSELADARGKRGTRSRTGKRPCRSRRDSPDECARSFSRSQSSLVGGRIFLQYGSELQPGILPAEHSSTMVLADA